jgi:hypothetical protein
MTWLYIGRDDDGMTAFSVVTGPPLEMCASGCRWFGVIYSGMELVEPSTGRIEEWDGSGDLAVSELKVVAV